MLFDRSGVSLAKPRTLNAQERLAQAERNVENGTIARGSYGEAVVTQERGSGLEEIHLFCFFSLGCANRGAPFPQEGDQVSRF